MYVWFKARKINNRFLHFIDLKDQIPQLHALSADTTVSKYATHLIYLTKKPTTANRSRTKILYSILSRKPKRADTYWFLHIGADGRPLYDGEQRGGIGTGQDHPG